MLNELDLMTIREQYQKQEAGSPDVDYDKLDRVIQNLRFFSHLPRHLRIKILKTSTYAFYPPKKVLFKQGDYGDMVYIILRGSVNVRSQKHTAFGIIEDYIITVLYDGTCFGEYAVMGTAQRKEFLKRIQNVSLAKLDMFEKKPLILFGD